jgi:hypothetical protein
LLPELGSFIDGGWQRGPDQRADPNPANTGQTLNDEIAQPAAFYYT